MCVYVCAHVSCAHVASGLPRVPWRAGRLQRRCGQWRCLSAAGGDPEARRAQRRADQGKGLQRISHIALRIAPSSKVKTSWMRGQGLANKNIIPLST
eukprot:1301211-Alexandrium_andersonii.AAC.1